MSDMADFDVVTKLRSKTQVTYLEMNNSVRPIEARMSSGVTGADNAGFKGDDSPDGGNDALDMHAFEPLLKTNQFQMRKTAAQALMDVALMMANISQLRTLVTAGESAEYFYPLVVLVSLSLASQVFFAILIFIIFAREADQDQREDHLGELKRIVLSNVVSDRSRFKAASQALTQSMSKREEDYRNNRITSHLNHATMVLVFLITVINMFITGFGIKMKTEV